MPSDTLMRQEPVDIVDELNRLMAEEAEACLRYFQLRYRLRGIDRQAAEEFFANGVKETLEHAEAIANQIRAIGHLRCVSTRGQSRFPSVLLQPLGHLSASLELHFATAVAVEFEAEINQQHHAQPVQPLDDQHDLGRAQQI